MTHDDGNKGRKIWQVMGALLWIAVILAILILSPKNSIWAWILTLGLLEVFFVAIGLKCKKIWFGVLIDERNKVSLSRFQITLWTILFLASLFAAALLNIFAGEPNPLDFVIPTEFWALMGISATSLVGSSLIKLNEPKRKLLITNEKAEEANFLDMFMGEEIGNHNYIDLSKVQMFFFTIVAVVVYAVGLGGIFIENYTHITEFPPFHAGLLALIGISHAGYLTYKAIPHPKIESRTRKRP